MKKILVYTCLVGLVLSSCRKDDIAQSYVEPADIAVQNNYDDEAITKYLKNNYFDTQGNIKEFSSTDASDDNYTSLYDEPTKQVLPSGVVIIPRVSAQPNPGTVIGNTDVMTMIMNSKTYYATNNDGIIALGAGTTFFDDVTYATMTKDPTYYYVKNSVLTNATTDAAKVRSYYEIEGFQEGIRKFKAFDQDNSTNYNMQGVIIVPSRDAFARDASYYESSTYSVRNRTFIFNFQVYKTKTRDMSTED